jgi:hypothetical protein
MIENSSSSYKMPSFPSHVACQEFFFFHNDQIPFFFFISLSEPSSLRGLNASVWFPSSCRRIVRVCLCFALARSVCMNQSSAGQTQFSPRRSSGQGCLRAENSPPSLCRLPSGIRIVPSTHGSDHIPAVARPRAGRRWFSSLCRRWAFARALTSFSSFRRLLVPDPTLKLGRGAEICQSRSPPPQLAYWAHSGLWDGRDDARPEVLSFDVMFFTVRR